MRTTHRFVHGDARAMREAGDASVALVVTSPPYPMIAMWDEAFAALDGSVAPALAAGDGNAAFEAMHRVLDRAWDEVARVVSPGGFACVNVGDATRTVGEAFRLYPNHARIVAAMTTRGFDVLPGIVWRKPTNAPNKFMGSGTLPAGAYVTLEHEHVLVFRKGGKRAFDGEAKARRRRSAYFFEERNVWFSDVWDLRGARQDLAEAQRERSAAFPFEVPWRLIHMFSLEGDLVLDPFAGTGTTLLAAAAAGRSSVGYDTDAALASSFGARLADSLGRGRAAVEARLSRHAAFVEERRAAGQPPGHMSETYGFPVVSSWETGLRFTVPVSCVPGPAGVFEVAHEAASWPPAQGRTPAVHPMKSPER